MKYSTALPLLAGFLLHLLAVDISAKEYELEQFITHEFDVTSHKSDSYCFSTASSTVGFSTIFDELRVEVKEVGGGDFEWHAVKGISTDDMHAHLEHIVLKVFGGPGARGSSDDEWLLEKHSFLRDIFSSCPSPVNAKNLHTCSMRFSAFGRSCVSIHSDRPHRVSIKGLQRFNVQHLYNMLAGVALIVLASYLAKSKVFQYSTGSFVFVVGGLVIIILYILMNASAGRRRNSTSWIWDASIAALFTTGYGASLVYFLRHNMRSLMLSHWEWVLGYVALFAAMGLLWVRFVRSKETSKENVRSAVKWVLRFAGAIGLYNASASPMGSLIILAALVAAYLVYAFNKQVIQKLANKKKQS